MILGAGTQARDAGKVVADKVACLVVYKMEVADFGNWVVEDLKEKKISIVLVFI